jgi:hypothetical protein
MSAARTMKIALAPVLAVSLLALAALPAHASPTSVIRDCSEDGVLDGKYSPSELDGALEQLPSDLDEYTDCRAVIRRAQLGASGNRRKRAPSAAERVDAGAPPSHKEQKEIADATRSGDPVRIGGTGVRPGESAKPLDTAGFGTDLPPLVLIVLLAIGGAFVSATALAARRRWAGSPAGGDGGPLRRIGREVRRGVSRFRR